MTSTTREVNLFCKNGYILQIDGSGNISGTRTKESKFAVIKVCTVDHGVVTLQAGISGAYVAVDNMGKVHTKKLFTEECLFYEECSPAHGYISYRSFRYGKRQYYLGISRRGRMRPASKILSDQNCAKFLQLNARETALDEQKKTKEHDIEQEHIRRALESQVQMLEVSKKVGLTKSQKQQARREALKEQKLAQPEVAETTNPSEKKRKKKKKKPVVEEGALDGKDQASGGKAEGKPKQQEVKQAKKESQTSGKDKQGKTASNEQTAKKQKQSETKEQPGKNQKQVENKDKTAKTPKQTGDKDQTKKKEKQVDSKKSDVNLEQKQPESSKGQEVLAESEKGKAPQRREKPAEDTKVPAKDSKQGSEASKTDIHLTPSGNDQADESTEQKGEESETMKSKDKATKKQDKKEGDNTTKQQKKTPAADNQSEPVKTKEEPIAGKVEMQHDGQMGTKDPTEKKEDKTEGKKKEKKVDKKENTKEEKKEVKKVEDQKGGQEDENKEEKKEEKKNAQKGDKKEDKTEDKKEDTKEKKEVEVKKEDDQKGDKTEGKKEEKKVEKKEEKKKDPKGDKKADKKKDKKEDKKEKNKEDMKKESKEIMKEEKGKLQKADKEVDKKEEKEDINEDKTEVKTEEKNPAQKGEKKGVKKEEEKEDKKEEKNKTQKADKIKAKKEDKKDDKKVDKKEDQKGGKKVEKSDKKETDTQSGANTPEVIDQSKQKHPQGTEQKKNTDTTVATPQQETAPPVEDTQSAPIKTADKDQKQTVTESKSAPMEGQSDVKKKTAKKRSNDDKSDSTLKTEIKDQGEKKDSNKDKQAKKSSKSENDGQTGKKQKKTQAKTDDTGAKKPKQEAPEKQDTVESKDQGAEDVAAKPPTEKGSHKTERKQTISESSNEGQETKKSKKKKKQKTNTTDAKPDQKAEKPKQQSHAPTDASKPEQATVTAAKAVKEQTTVADVPSVPQERVVDRQPTDDSEPKPQAKEVVLGQQEAVVEQSQPQQVQELNNNQASHESATSSARGAENQPPSEVSYQASGTTEEIQPLLYETAQFEESSIPPVFGTDPGSQEQIASPQLQIDPTGNDIPTPIPTWSDIVQQPPQQIDQQQVGSPENVQPVELVKQSVPDDPPNSGQDIPGQIPLATEQMTTEGSPSPSWSDIVQQSPPQAVNGDEVPVQAKLNAGSEQRNQSCQEALAQSQVTPEQPSETHTSASLDQNQSTAPDNVSQSDQLASAKPTAEEIKTDKVPTWSDIVQHSPQQTPEVDTLFGANQTGQPSVGSPDISVNNEQVSSPVGIPTGQVPDVTASRSPTWSDIVQHSPPQAVPQQTTPTVNNQTEVHISQEQASQPKEPLAEQVTEEGTKTPLTTMPAVPTSSVDVVQQVIQGGQEQVVGADTACCKQAEPRDAENNQKTIPAAPIQSEPDAWEQYMGSTEGKQDLAPVVSAPVEPGDDIWEQYMGSPDGKQDLASTEPDAWEQFMDSPEDKLEPVHTGPVESELDVWEQFMGSSEDKQGQAHVFPAETTPDVWEDFMSGPEGNQDATSTAPSQLQETQDNSNNTSNVSQEIKTSPTSEQTQTEKQERDQFADVDNESQFQPPQDHDPLPETVAGQPSFQQKEALKEPVLQVQQQGELQAAPSLPPSQQQPPRLSPTDPYAQQSVQDPSLEAAAQLSHAPTPAGANNSAIPYDHPWTADFNQQQSVSIPMEPDANIWDQYMGPAGVATGVDQKPSTDVWDQYMTPMGFMEGQEAGATSMQFAHAFFEDDINDDQLKYDEIGQRNITGQQSINPMPGQQTIGQQAIGDEDFGSPVDGPQFKVQPLMEQSVRREEQIPQATAQPVLMQEPQLGYTGFSEDNLGPPVPLPQQQAVTQNIGSQSSSNVKQPDLIASMVQTPPIGNIPSDMPTGANVQVQQQPQPKAGANIPVPQQPQHQVGGNAQVSQQSQPKKGGSVQVPQQPQPKNSGSAQVTQQPQPKKGGNVQVPQQPKPKKGGNVQVPQQPQPKQGGNVQVPQQPQPKQGGNVQVPQQPQLKQRGNVQVPQQPQTKVGGDVWVPQVPQPQMGGNAPVPQQPQTKVGGDVWVPQQPQPQVGGNAPVPQQPPTQVHGDVWVPQQPQPQVGGNVPVPQQPHTQLGQQPAGGAQVEEALEASMLDDLHID